MYACDNNVNNLEYLWGKESLPILDPVALHFSSPEVPSNHYYTSLYGIKT